MTAERERELSRRFNEHLHPNGVAACETACTHVIEGRWTALGLANVLARRVVAIEYEEGAQ